MSGQPDVDWSRLPVPTDDGGADHLEGARVPAVALPATDGRDVDLSRLPGLTVVFAYPRTAAPDRPSPKGWDEIPGARGCTPQACAFRDRAAELAVLGVQHLFGLSTQPPAEQREAADRLALSYPLLSDHERRLAHALELPTFEVEGMRLMKRLTLVIRDGAIVRCFYPVFPPDDAPAAVAAWLTAGA